MAFTVSRCQGAGLLQTLLQLGQRFIHQRFYFRHIRRSAFLFEQGNGVFVFLDLLRGVGRVKRVTVLKLGHQGLGFIDDLFPRRHRQFKLLGDGCQMLVGQGTLVDKAETLMPELKDGDSFDAAYTAQQVKENEEAIALFKQEGAASDVGWPGYAR